MNQKGIEKLRRQNTEDIRGTPQSHKDRRASFIDDLRLNFNSRISLNSRHR